MQTIIITWRFSVDILDTREYLITEANTIKHLLSHKLFGPKLDFCLKYDCSQFLIAIKAWWIRRFLREAKKVSSADGFGYLIQWPFHFFHIGLYFLVSLEERLETCSMCGCTDLQTRTKCFKVLSPFLRLYWLNRLKRLERILCDKRVCLVKQLWWAWFPNFYWNRNISFTD